MPLHNDWTSHVKKAARYRALVHKFNASAELRTLLLSTRGHTLVSVKREAYWGAGLDGTGQNQLGILLEKIRDKFAYDDELDSVLTGDDRDAAELSK